MSKWFDSALFYEIYPTSFYDVSGDGIGDFKGILAKLSYIKNLGFNAIWLNPFYESPFNDGGYDIIDYFKVDKRFGTNDSFCILCQAVHQLDMHIIIDLVPGHMSEESKMFMQSGLALPNEYSNLFIWNDCVWNYQRPYVLISGRHQRNASYMVNFFSHQPALNYGFNKITYPTWQMSYTDERTFQARRLMKDVMKFWLDLGADGFRVDMADSLVKDDDEVKSATTAVWQDIFSSIKEDYPNCFLIAEWSNPKLAFKAMFDADFVLDHWDNCMHRLARSTESTRGVASLNGGDLDFFVHDLRERVNDAKNNNGYLSFISGNHDTTRIASFLDNDGLRIFYLMLYTLPGIPFMYYGDEIGMKHANLTSKDGGYQRTGDRTPMQWHSGFNRGFSFYKGKLYLPVSRDDNDVDSEEKIPSSLLNYIKSIVSFRLKHPNLVNNNLTITNNERILIYERDNIRVIVNLSKDKYQINDKDILFASHNDALDGKMLLPNRAVIIGK